MRQNFSSDRNLHRLTLNASSFSQDVPKEDTVLLLNYMYKGKMEIENGGTLRKALTHAVRFNMGSLVEGIEKAFDFQHHSAILLYNLGI